MTASSRIALALVLAGCVGIAAAQDKAAQDKAAPAPVNVEDLRIRSGKGDRTATRQLAEMYYLGRGGVEQNFSEAARWYEILARQGDRRAQTSLGLIYARGYGVTKNLELAHKWWSLAALQGDAGAQYNLGTLYFRGEGVTKDYEQAARWYRDAAQRGHVQAQSKLGSMYYEGQGMDKSSRQAYYWLKVAALQGDDEAQSALPVVAKGMSAGEIRDADDQAGEWMKKYKKIVGK
jgi:uncharacterized protein